MEPILDPRQIRNIYSNLMSVLIAETMMIEMGIPLEKSKTEFQEFLKLIRSSLLWHEFVRRIVEGKDSSSVLVQGFMNFETTLNRVFLVDSHSLSTWEWYKSYAGISPD